MSDSRLTPGRVVSGPLLSEPHRIETVQQNAAASWTLGLVGLRSERFRRLNLTTSDLATLRFEEAACNYAGNPTRLRLGVQAYSLGISYEFDPYFGLSISRVDPLPHQLEAVYDYLLKVARVRFLLADDAGAGKTVMAGLLIRELKLRGLAERILVVCPANLAFQWQRELKEKFDEKFEVLRGDVIREQFGINQWMERNHVITSLDLAKREDILPGLKQVHWDLIIVDEAHRMSWSPPARKTARYALGELLRDSSDHLLLLTATPHKGEPENFSLFLQLLDTDAYADVKSIKEAMEKRRAPFYLRRTKEAMVYFPERQEDGTWAAKKIFTKRIPKTADFGIDGDEFQLYQEVTRFVKRQSAKAAAQGDNPRARAVGFLMSLYQRRLASSAYALRRSLDSRARRLEEGLKRANELTAAAPPRMPDTEDIEEMDDVEKGKFEELIAAITLSQNADQVREEILELKDLARDTKKVEDDDGEAKLSHLKDTLKKEGFFDNPQQRLLLFTEFKDTLDYLTGKLVAWGFRVGNIHGGMAPGDRESKGTRIYVEQQFRDGDIQVLVATEAAGEGINLQCCHILFNYDIPWNPNRLEQRMGRIHRYGQTKDCLIFNFVATNTIEGRVLHKLLEKLQEIRDALDDDAVFNVVGEVLPAAHIERVLRDYYAGKLGDADLEDNLLRDVDEGRFRNICKNALEGLASKKLNLNMLIERRAKAQERRVVPETIARFLADGAEQVAFGVKPVPRFAHTYDPPRTPTALRRYDSEPDWKFARVADKYPRYSTDRETATANNFEWVTPGHPLFESLRRHMLHLAQPEFATGACLYSVKHDQPMRLDFYRARVVDGLGKTIHERLFALELRADGTVSAHEPAILGDLSPAPTPAELPPVAHAPEASAWLDENALQPFLGEVRGERLEEIDRIAAHVELSLNELVQKADEEVGKIGLEIDQKVPGAEGRLASAENRMSDLLLRRERRRDELGRQRSLSLQAVERLTSVLILPHPERQAPELSNLRQNPETERIAMEFVMRHEEALGRKVFDVSEKNLGYDVTSLDVTSGDLRLIEVKGIGAASGSVILTPNERKTAEDRPDCYWLYVVTNCNTTPTLEQIPNPARFDWHEVQKVAHYSLSLDEMRKAKGDGS
jgi:superfamily II DNA or RNA helicase